MLRLDLPDHVNHGETRITYAADSLITFHHFEGAYDPAFRFALDSARALVKHPLYHEWRLYIGVQCIYQQILSCIRHQTPFLYLECGVGEAHLLLTSYFFFKSLNQEIFDYFCSSPKVLVDTFNGIDTTLIDPSDTKEYVTESYLGANYEVVARRLSFIDSVHFLVGSVPSVLDTLENKYKRPAFLHIDMNHSVPELAALKYFMPAMMRGSVILLDDYSFQSATQSRNSINEWLRRTKQCAPINLPTGQGMILL